MSNNIGKNIKHYRKLAGLSQDELAKRIGVSLQFIRLIETQNKLPSLENFIKICDALEAPADYLLKDEGRFLRTSAMMLLYEELKEMPDEDFNALFTLTQKLCDYKREKENRDKD